MYLILCGDPKQGQQENSLLRFITIYFGMQLINMTSTKLQNKHKERSSFPIKMIHVMILNMILKKKILQYSSSDPEYLGSSYNLLIEWETGEMTWEPISNIIASDPYTCAVYAMKHDLLITSGWKLLKIHARTA